MRSVPFFYQKLNYFTYFTTYNALFTKIFKLKRRVRVIPTPYNAAKSLLVHCRQITVGTLYYHNHICETLIWGICIFSIELMQLFLRVQTRFYSTVSLICGLIMRIFISIVVMSVAHYF